MNKKISIGLCLSLIIVSITATFAVTMVVSKQIYNGIISNISQRSQTYESVDEISKIISNYFYGTVEDRSYLNSALVEGYVNGLGDPNSVYLDAEEYAEYTDTLEGGITGVGVETAYDYGSGSFVITHVYEGSPAAKAGLKAHDVVTAIDNTTVTRGNYSALSEKLYGSRLSSVKVEYERDGETKVVETFRTNYECKAVIIASGGKNRLTGAPGEDKYLFDKGISFCATCDAAANTGKTVMVIGSGDAAIEEGMFLTRFASRVIVSVMHDEGKMDCNEIAKAEAMENPKMEFLWNTLPHEFRGDDQHLHSVALKNTKTGEILDVPVDTCFLFIGYVPNTEIFQGKVELNKPGYVITNERMETNIPGVYAAGDVRDKWLKQVATAVGDGAIAGYTAEKYIAETNQFNTQIMDAAAPGLVYIYNAVVPASRELLPLVEQFEEKHPEVRVNRVDVYKSEGIARRLGVADIPAAVYIKEGKAAGSLTGGITLESLEALTER